MKTVNREFVCMMSEKKIKEGERASKEYTDRPTRTNIRTKQKNNAALSNKTWTT